MQWYKDRTTKTVVGESTYEVTISALTALISRMGACSEYYITTDFLTLVDQPTFEVIEEPLSPKLNERQLLVLYVVGEGRFDLLDASKAANVKTIDQLVELGVLDDWRRMTDLGRAVLKGAKS